MDDKELEAIVQRMIDAGEPEESIAIVIQEYQPQEAAFTADPGVAAQETSGGGGLFATGAIAKGVAEAAPAVLHRMGQAMRDGSGRIIRGAAAAAGASAGAGLGALVGHPFAGAGAGADVGRHVARKYLTPAVRAVGKGVVGLTESGYPESIYAGKPALAAGRKALGFGLKRAVPVVGNALMAADVAKMLYDRVKGIPGAIRENSNMLVADSSYQTPEDEELLRLLAERGQ